MIHHADFAIPVLRELVVEADLQRPGTEGTIQGAVLALGWWVDPPGTAPSPGEREPTGTLYLIADAALPRPVWVAQGSLVRFRVS